MLLVGFVMMVMRFQEQDAHIFKVVALTAPGLVITVITQAHWSRHKSGFTGSEDAGQQAHVQIPGATDQETPRRRTRQRRRGRARARGRR